jgi:hypothetical protein
VNSGRELTAISKAITSARAWHRIQPARPRGAPHRKVAFARPFTLSWISRTQLDLSDFPLRITRSARRGDELRT